MINKLRFPLTRTLPVMWLGLAGTLCTAAPAFAQTNPACTSFPNPVFIVGSSAVKPLLTALQMQLAAANPPISIIYASPGSCVGVSYMQSSPAGTLSGSATTWNSAGTATPCDTTALTGDVVNVGVSDVFPATCPNVTLDPAVHDFHGPIQSMTFSVPITSTQTSISVEAAYMVFGFGASSGVAPGQTPLRCTCGNATSGTQQMISAALAQVGSGFSASKVLGTDGGSSQGVETALTTDASVGNAEESIGFLSMDEVDISRGSVKPLAFQFIGQPSGYMPDSSPTTYDKQNVRDGHYAIWGPLHLLTPVDSNGVPLNPNAATIIGYLTGSILPPFDLIQVEAQAQQNIGGGGVVPDCAMRVQRTSEVGPMASYMPPKIL